MLCKPAFAVPGGLRDAEIEADLRTIATPILEQAGLNPDQVRLIVISDDTINAFVAGGQNLFLYTGLILETEDVSQLGGVIAHEAGHMAGGHLIRMRGAMERASLESMIATIGGIAAGVGSGQSDIGIAGAAGGGEFARRRMLSHSRALESAADQAGMSTLERVGLSARGMAAFLEKLSGQEVLPEMQRSGYILTHPLSRERMQTVDSFVARSRHKDDAWPADWQEKFKRMQAKIVGFTAPQRAERQYASDQSVAGRYARAIASYRQGRIPEALASVAALEKEEPNNAWFAELRGQILFEQGNIAPAIAAYRRARQLAPQSGLVAFELAQALLQDESKAPLSEAAQLLEFARAHGEKDTASVYRWLAVAYGRSGREGLAKLALAERALLQGDYNFAISQGNAAREMLKNDGPARQRAQDIVNDAQRGQKDRDRD